MPRHYLSTGPEARMAWDFSTEPEFEAKLTLNAVNVTGDRMVDLFYDDE